MEIFGPTACAAMGVRAFDPETGAVLVNELQRGEPQLLALEDQAISDVLTLHGLPAADEGRLLAWATGPGARPNFCQAGRTLSKNLRRNVPVTSKCSMTWLTNVVWQKRIDAAQFAWEQYLGWQNAVDYATCSWQPPNSTYWQPKWRTESNDPQLISCQEDITIGGQTVQRLCQINGCSPGLDGTPRTDPTPNEGRSTTSWRASMTARSCFASGEFAYDAVRKHDAPVASPAFCNVASPAHPTYEQFKATVPLGEQSLRARAELLINCWQYGQSRCVRYCPRHCCARCRSCHWVVAIAGGLSAFGLPSFSLLLGDWRFSVER